MAAAQVGDADAYRILLSELVGWLRRYYARRLPPVMTEDAVQDALLAIHEKRHTYDPERPFEPWLGAIARYKWVARLRALEFETAEPFGENIGIRDREGSVVDGSTFQQLVAELKPPQVEAIRLVMLEGHSVEEASHATGQSISLIKVNMLRGIRRLANIIRAAGDADRLLRRSPRPEVAPAQRRSRSASALAHSISEPGISTRSRRETCHD